MAVQLKDAKITVEIDVQKAGADVDSLEERTKRQRDEAQKEERESKRREDRQKDRAKRRGGLAGRLAAQGLVTAAAGALRSIPLAGFGFGLGIAAAEASETFGPFIKGTLDELLPEAVRKLLGVDRVEELGEFWNSTKNVLRSMTEGFSQAQTIAATDIVGGGTVGAAEFAKLFTIGRRQSEFQADLQFQRRRMEQTIIGRAVGKETRDAIRKALQSSMNR